LFYGKEGKMRGEKGREKKRKKRKRKRRRKEGKRKDRQRKNRKKTNQRAETFGNNILLVDENFSTTIERSHESVTLRRSERGIG
jgi:hypothetical protein